MDVPGIVESALDGEDVAAHVLLGGEDAAYVTPSRTLVYRGEGLLSDESVEEFPHDAERVAVSEGRRSATIHLDYGLDGERDLSVPSDRVDDVLHSVLAGVFSARGVTDPGETAVRMYRFSELTLVVTSDRVVKHVGEAVWGEEYEEVAFDAVTGIAVEEGDVASQFVLETGDRTERIKTPNEQARDVRETVQQALFDYYGVSSREEFERAVGDADADADAEPATADDPDDVSFARSGLDPIEGTTSDDDSAGATEATETAPAETGQAGDGFTDSAFETASATPERDDDGGTAAEGDDDGASPDDGRSAGGRQDGEREAAVAEQLEALRDALDRQQALIERQRATIDRLAERLSRDP